MSTISNTSAQLPKTPPPPPGVHTGGAAHIVKSAALFGAVGAAAGFGISFLTLPVVGQLGAPIAAAIGGAAGILAGAVKGIVDNRRAHGGGFASPLTAAAGAATLTPPPGAVVLRA